MASDEPSDVVTSEDEAPPGVLLATPGHGAEDEEEEEEADAGAFPSEDFFEEEDDDEFDAAPEAVAAMILDVAFPVLTDKLTRYLFTGDKPCLHLLAAVTLCPDDSNEESRTEEDHNETQTHDELRRSFRAARLLGGDASQSESFLLPFLEPSAKLLTAHLFDVFDPKARGCVSHAVHVFSRLLEHYPDRVYEGCRDAGALKFLRLIDASQKNGKAGDLLLDLAAPGRKTAYDLDDDDDDDDADDDDGQYKDEFFPSLASTETRPSASARWKFVKFLSELRLVSETARRAPRVFGDLVDALSRDRNGEVLLQPLAHASLDDALVGTMQDKDVPYPQRLEAARCLVAAVNVGLPPSRAAFKAKQKASPANEDDDTTAATTTTTSEARTRGVRRALITSLRTKHLKSLCSIALAADKDAPQIRRRSSSDDDDESGDKRVSPQRVSPQRFTLLRLCVVELIVVLCEHDDETEDEEPLLGKTRRKKKKKKTKRPSSSRVPSSFWRAAADWFAAEGREPSCFDALFYDLCHRALTQHVALPVEVMDAIVRAASASKDARKANPHAVALCGVARLSRPELLDASPTWRRQATRVLAALKRQARLRVFRPLPRAAALSGSDDDDDTHGGLGLGSNGVGREDDIGRGSPYAAALGVPARSEFDENKTSRRQRPRGGKESRLDLEDDDDDVVSGSSSGDRSARVKHDALRSSAGSDDDEDFGDDDDDDDDDDEDEAEEEEDIVDDEEECGSLDASDDDDEEDVAPRVTPDDTPPEEEEDAASLLILQKEEEEDHRES